MRWLSKTLMLEVDIIDIRISIDVEALELKFFVENGPYYICLVLPACKFIYTLRSMINYAIFNGIRKTCREKIGVNHLEFPKPVRILVESR